MLETIAENGNLLKFASDTFKEDREIVMAAVMQNGLSLEYASEELREDREIVMAAVMQNGLSLKFARAFRTDREVVRAAVRENGISIAYTTRTLAADRELFLEAVTQNGIALGYATPELRSDDEVVMTALSKNGYALKYLPVEFVNHERSLAAVTQNGLALNYVPRDIIDREIALAAIEENGNALKYVPRKFAEDPEIALVIQNLRERNQWIRERQQREERSRKNASSAFLESIKRKPMHTLSATLHTIELHKSQLQKDEEKLRRREDELAEFQPTIIKMEQQKPERYDRNPLRDNPSYREYREYLAEKNRIESNLEVVKHDIEFHKNRIMELEESIEEWDPEQSEERDAQMRERFLHDDKDIDTIHNGNIFDKATRRNYSVSHHSRQKQELTPLQKLSNHGEGFRRTFVDLTKSFQGQPDAKKRMGYPVKGGKTKKRYKYGTRHRNI